jgi:hypothetical protein
MKTIEFIGVMVAFALLTHRCGKSIAKQDWDASVAYFLLALGMILTVVRSIPPFDWR